MFVINEAGQKKKIGLTKGRNILKTVLIWIYELSEEGLSPEYYQEWLESQPYNPYRRA
jgi:hypothetical protein